jgi:hypothetical protein
LRKLRLIWRKLELIEANSYCRWLWCSYWKVNLVELSVCFSSLVIRHDGVWGRRNVDPSFLDLGAKLPSSLSPRKEPPPPRTRWIVSWMSPRTGLEAIEKWRFLTYRDSNSDSSVV